jgi:hypothetical protein
VTILVLLGANALLSLLFAVKQRYRYVVRQPDGRFVVRGDRAGFWPTFGWCFLGLAVVSAFAFLR